MSISEEGLGVLKLLDKPIYLVRKKKQSKEPMELEMGMSGGNSAEKKAGEVATIILYMNQHQSPADH